MDPFASTPAQDVRPGDMMVWQYVTGVWNNGDDTVSVVLQGMSGGAMITTVNKDEDVAVTAINCPKCGHHINPNVEGE